MCAAGVKYVNGCDDIHSGQIISVYREVCNPDYAELASIWILSLHTEISNNVVVHQSLQHFISQSCAALMFLAMCSMACINWKKSTAQYRVCCKMGCMLFSFESSYEMAINCNLGHLAALSFVSYVCGKVFAL